MKTLSMLINITSWKNLKLLLTPLFLICLSFPCHSSIESEPLALNSGDFASCVRLPEVFHPQRDPQNTSPCLEQPEGSTQRFTLLEFFTVTCGYCIESLPHLSQLASEIKHSTTVRMVSLTRQSSAVEQFIKKHQEHVHFPVLIDHQKEATQQYGVRLVPALFLLNAKGKVLFSKVGVLSSQDSKKIKLLIQENKDDL